MKILHCSDAHIDWSTAGFPRFDDVERALEQTVRAAVDEKVALYAFTGDLADPDGGSVVLRAVSVALDVVRELDDYDIDSAWVAGNHDVAEDGYGTTTLTPLIGMKFADVFNNPGAVDLPWGRLIGLPYPSAATKYDPAAKLAELTNDGKFAGKLVVATHLQLPGIVPGEESLEMPRGRDVPFPWEACRPEWLVLGGHYHERQIWRGQNGVRVHIAGSLARLTHGEERNRPSFQIHEF